MMMCSIYLCSTALMAIVHGVNGDFCVALSTGQMYYIKFIINILSVTNVVLYSQTLLTCRALLLEILAQATRYIGITCEQRVKATKDDNRITAIYGHHYMDIATLAQHDY